jgi:hypothetical protein
VADSLSVRHFSALIEVSSCRHERHYLYDTPSHDVSAPGAPIHLVAEFQLFRVFACYKYWIAYEPIRGRHDPSFYELHVGYLI